MIIDPSKCREVPEWLRPAFADALQSLPKEWLLRWGSLLPGGFRKTPQILSALRDHTRQHALLPEDWVAIFGAEHPACQTLRSLDSKWIQSAFADLLDAMGPSSMAFALWMDERPDLSKLALPSLVKVPPAPPETRGKNWAKLVHRVLLQPFHLHPPEAPQSLAAPAAISQSTGPHPAEQHLKNRLKELERKLAESLEQRRREQRAHEESVATLKQDLSAALDARAQLENDFNRRLREETDRAVAAHVRPWLARAVAMEEAVDAATAAGVDELIAQSTAALDRQSRVDRQQSHHQRLRSELRRLQEMRESVQIALSGTLHPLSEWPALQARLDDAIRSRRELLGDVPAGAPWAADLASEVATAPNLSEVDAVMRRSEALHQAGLLKEPARAWLQRRIAERRSALQDPILATRSPRAVQIRDVLTGQAPGMILIDAFNWISLGAGELGMSTDPTRFTATLRDLRPVLTRLAASARQARIILVADGPQENHLTLATNLHIEWSGGQGRNRADQVITGRVQHARTEEPQTPVWVVTDDKSEAQACRESGATIESPVAFSRRLVALIH